MNRSCLWLLLPLLIITGCATRPTDPDDLLIYQQNNDPIEPFNRTVFKFNDSADEYVLTPVIKGYRHIVPNPLREGIDNFFTNLKQPVYFVNAVLQADFSAAGSITGRFLVNSLLGFFGTVDAASSMNIPSIKRDFGQTLAVWGIKSSGPYLVLPLLGPSTLRDTVGMGVDAFADPVDWALYHRDPWIAWTRAGANGFISFDHAHDLMDNMKKNSTDYYATMRSMYQQNRQETIRILRGDPAPEVSFDFPDDDEEEE